MSDGKIHIPARKRAEVESPQVVRVSPEAYNVLVEVYNESNLSMKEIASVLILHSADQIVYDREESNE